MFLTSRALNTFPLVSFQERDLTLVEINATGPDGTPIVIPTLNGLGFLDPPTETPRVNTVELWRLINLTPDTHPIHLHLVQFRLLERRPFDVAAYDANGEIVYTGPPLPPDPNENGFKDTIRANPGEVTTILVPFEVRPKLSVFVCVCVCGTSLLSCEDVWPRTGLHGQLRMALPHPGARGQRHDEAARGASTQEALPLLTVPTTRRFDSCRRF